MKQLRFTDRFKMLFNMAVRLSETVEADGVMILLDGTADWARLRKQGDGARIIVVANTPAELAGASDAGLSPVAVNMPGRSTISSPALLEAVADDILAPGSRVVAVYSGFEPDTVDSVSVISLGEHLDRLTGRDFAAGDTGSLGDAQGRSQLAVEIGREGASKPVGTMFVVGDTRKVLNHSKPAGFDPVRGYNRKEHPLEARVREGIKSDGRGDHHLVGRNR